MPTQGHPVLLAAEPQLFVADIARSLAFFAEKLGFATVFTAGDPPFYAQVARDMARLNLRHVDAPLADKALARRESYLSASITLATRVEIEQLFGEYEAAGCTFQQELDRKPWGVLDFVVLDPDGNLLSFAGPVE